MNKNSLDLIPKNIDELVKTKRLKKPAKGILGEISEVDLEKYANRTDHENSAIEAANSIIRNNTSMKVDFGTSIDRAVKKADEILIRYGLSTDIPKYTMEVTDLWVFELDENIKRLNENERLIIQNGDLELLLAFELKCAVQSTELFSDVVREIETPSDGEFSYSLVKGLSQWFDFGIRNAIRIGQLWSLLETDAKYGPTIDAKRRSHESIRKINQKKREMLPTSKELKMLSEGNPPLFN